MGYAVRGTTAVTSNERGAGLPLGRPLLPPVYTIHVYSTVDELRYYNTTGIQDVCTMTPESRVRLSEVRPLCDGDYQFNITSNKTKAFVIKFDTLLCVRVS